MISEDHVTLKTGHFKRYSHRKQLFEIVIIFHNITIYCYIYIYIYIYMYIYMIT